MANRFWVATAGGTWDGTTTANWSATSGGASGASVPISSDDVFINASSGSATITLGASRVCRSLNFTGYTGTFSHPASTTISIGDGTAGASNIALLVSAGMTYTIGDTTTNTSIVNLISTSATVQTITSNGKTLPSITINGTGNSYQLADAITNGNYATFSLLQGTFSTNNQTCTFGQFTSATGSARTINLGSSAITLTKVTGTVWSIANSGVTVNAGTSTIVASGQTGAWIFSGGSFTYNSFSYSGSQGITLSNGSTFGTLSFTPPAAGSLTVTIAAATTTTVTTQFTSVGLNSGTTCGRVEMATGIPGVIAQANLVLNCATTVANTDFAGIAVTGTAAPLTGTQLGNAGLNSGITFPTSRTLYWILVTGGAMNLLANWSLSSGGASASTTPLPQDDLIFDANSITSSGRTISVASMRWIGRNVNFTGILNNPQFSIGSFNCAITGNLTLAAGMTTNSTTTASITLMGMGTQTLTTNGVQINFNLQVGPVSGSYTLQDSLTMPFSNSVTHVSGGFSDNGKTMTMGAFTSNATNTRTITLTGNHTLGSSGFLLNVSDVNLTWNATASTITVGDTSASQKTINMPNQKIMGTINIPSAAQSVLLEWAGVTNTHFGIITNLTASAPVALQFIAGQTTTFTNAPVMTGTAGNLITITSSTSGTQYNLSKTSGTINCNYLSLQDSNATGGASWYAGANSTNVSNNTGWIFTAANFAIAKTLQYDVRKTKTAITKTAQYMVKHASAFTSILMNGSSYLQITDDNGGLDIGNNSWTYVIRFKAPAIPASDAMLVCKATNSDVFSLFVQMTGGTGSLDIRMYDGTHTVTGSVSGNWTDNTIHRLVLVRDDTAATLTAYLDGVSKLVISTSTLTVTSLLNGDPITFGAFPDASNTVFSRYLKYYLIESALYYGTITSTDVTNLEGGVKPTNIQRNYLALTENTGTSTADVSGYANPAFLYAGSAWATVQTLSKTLQYDVRRTTAAITKSLRYVIKLPSTAITKSLKYDIRRSPALTKSLRYCIRGTHSLTKSLQYDIRRTKTAITKSLRYTIKGTTTLTRSLQYAIDLPSILTKSLQYEVRVHSVLTKSLKYEVKKARQITKTLIYRVKTTPSPLTKALFYKIKPVSHIVPLILRYKVTGTQSYFVKTTVDTTDNWVKHSQSTDSIWVEHSQPSDGDFL